MKPTKHTANPSKLVLMRARKLTVGLVPAVCAVVGVLVLASAPATAAGAEGGCPNEALRQGLSAHLPDCRAYEMVSPVFKGGYGAGEILGVEPNGESVAFASIGVFAGAPLDQTIRNDYQATRSGSGWSTVSVMPPASLAPESELRSFSPSLGASLWDLRLGGSLATAAGLGTELQLASHAVDAPDTEVGFQSVAPVLKRVDGGQFKTGYSAAGVSDDFCHDIVEDSFALLPEASGITAGQLYDVSAGCHGEPPSVRLVALNSAGDLLSPNCEVYLGYPITNDQFHAVSADGNEIFFSASTPSALCSSPQLFVRVGGSRTLEVSKPLNECEAGEVPCGGMATRARAAFQGASEDGSRVLFTTTAPLAPATDQDTENDLYMAKIGCPGGETDGCEAGQRVVTGLVQVSHDPDPGEAAEVQGVVAIAPDGSRVYFVARGLLAEGANSQGVAPVRGADNLYVYDEASAETAFVGELCSGPELSGQAPSASCPADLEGATTEIARNDKHLWQFPYGPAQVAGADGRFLVFSTYAQLITAGPEADTDDAQDVYRYDAQSGALERVSLGEAGHDANGNQNGGEEIESNGLRVADARIQPVLAGDGSPELEERGVVRRAISEDGSRIVFVTAAPLSPAATNGLVNVYEWHEGAVSLVSSGSAPRGDVDPVITPSGRDVFFTTDAGLVAADGDGAPDIYDARSDGGFPLVGTQKEVCSGDACQGPLTNPAPLLVPGSVPQAPGENMAPVKAATKKQIKKRASTKKRKRKKGKVRRASRRAHIGGIAKRKRGRS